jgi:hypothetical protein
MIAATAGGAALAGLALVALVASGGSMVRKTNMAPQHLLVSSPCTTQDNKKKARVDFKSTHAHAGGTQEGTPESDSPDGIS